MERDVFEDFNYEFINRHIFVVVESIGNGWCYGEFDHYSLTEDEFYHELDKVRDSLDENRNYFYREWITFFVNGKCIESYKND